MNKDFTERQSARRNRLGYVLALLLAIGGLAAAAWASKRGEPPQLEEVAAVWVGHSSDEKVLVRLNLDTAGTGSGGYLYLDEGPRIFRIPSWEYRRGSIEILPSPMTGGPSWVGPMSGEVFGRTMQLRVSADDWEIEFKLYKERELENGLKKLKQAMQ